MKNSTKPSEKAGSKPVFVMDSSIAIKWLTQEEPFYKEASKILEDYLYGKIEISVPDIFWLEIGNFFGREANLNTATVVWMNLRKYRLPTYILTDGASIQSFKIMKEHKGVSFYDASYHSLALQLGATFVTSDKKYVEKVKDFGSICHLPDYK